MKRKKVTTRKPKTVVSSAPVQVQPAPVRKPLDKKTLILVGLAIAAIAGLYLARSLFVAATVNGQPISRLQVVQTLEKQSGTVALNSLITERLISEEAAKKGVVVSQADIDAEIKKIEASIAQQGGTLDQALAQQGMTKDILRENLKSQKMVEKLVGDKIKVSDEEVEQYIQESETVIAEGEEAETKKQIMEQLKQQKFQEEAQAWVESLRKAAKISRYVSY